MVIIHLAPDLRTSLTLDFHEHMKVLNKGYGRKLAHSQVLLKSLHPHGMDNLTAIMSDIECTNAWVYAN